MSADPGSRAGDAVSEALERAARVLPDQGPIDVFIHHNTLHAFQHLYFDDAVRAAAEVFGAEPYMSEEAYRALHREGRIEDEDLDAALATPGDAALADAAPGDAARRPFLAAPEVIARLAMLHPIEATTDAALAFQIDEDGLLERLRADVSSVARQRLVAGTRRALGDVDRQDAEAVATALVGRDGRARAELLAALDRRRGPPSDLALGVAALWASATRLARGHVSTSPARRAAVLRPRDRVLAASGLDLDERVHAVLVRLAAAFLDRGLAHWTAPRSPSFLAWAGSSLRDAALAPRWLALARERLAAFVAAGASAEVVIERCLAREALHVHEWGDYLERVALALPGWAGMFARLEHRPPWGEALTIAPRLADFLALRLVLDRAAADDAIEASSPADVPEAPRPPSERADAAFRLFQLLQLVGVAPSDLVLAAREDAHAALGVLDARDGIARRRLWHHAYERWHRRTILSAIAKNRALEAAEPPAAPRVQLVFCIDDREESLRRHIEEARPDFATHATAGFFGLAIAHHGLERARPEPLCPANQVPRHLVVEAPASRASGVEAHAGRRHLLGRLLHAAHVASRGLGRAALASLLAGTLALLPMLLRVLSPRLARAARDAAHRLVAARPSTRVGALAGEGSAPNIEPAADLARGFRREEAALRLTRTFEELGVQRFAPLVFVVGHGGSTRNNPHDSAYHCGACGGHRGAANARVFAALANDPDVRADLLAGGIAIPDDTWFVGACHDTTTDAVALFDVDLVPERHRALFAEARAVLDRARRLDAQERCRRFEAFPLDGDPDAALQHVEARAESLAEPRPELGHCTNAIAIIGRRALTRGLFLDRRAFLCCYEPDRDAGGRVLERILGAVAPVGAGISLEYYFSFVDNERFGSGTKLPHNVVGLLGVMNGHQSDLRTGLPWQMVEVHEPVRLLVVVESTPATLLAIAARAPVVRELVVNGWIQLAAIDPESGAVSVMTRDGFEPFSPDARPLPVAPSSTAYCGGRRGHLWPARVGRAGDARSEVSAA
ncbi:MAG: DUF2309 domain-containing protein [Labilithrix sp.]|nr:DUF2309 domain-containing protein [Labilithrix sp.]